MATAIYPLNKFQIGLESTKGTLVAATRLIPCDAEMVETNEPYHSDYSQGVRANAGGLGAIVYRESRCTVNTELTAEEVLWPFETGVKGGITPSGAGAAKTWLYTPELTTGIPTINTATAEMVMTDGSTNHYYNEFGYAMTETFTYEWIFNQIATHSWTMFGRARATDTPTPALVPYTTREPLVSNLLFVYLDTTWAGMGGTQLTGTVRRVQLVVTTGYMPDYTLDGRASLDMVEHNVGRITARLTMELELDALGSARFTSARANTAQFIRLKSTGNAISGGGVKTVQIDGAYRWVSSPGISRDGDQMLVNCELETYYDITGTKTLEFTAINELAAI